MVSVRLQNRKSKVLTPSQLKCLSKIPTINISTGCIHGCIYCYARGYSQYPGDGSITLFANTAEQVGDELARKRSKPQAVYFCPSCDPFQPVEALLEQTYKTMEILLKSSVGVQFVTKARVPEKFLKLFAKYNRRVGGRIGLTSVDENIRKIFEPAAATVAERLATLKSLVEIGVEASARADPLIHRLTDSDESLRQLLSEIAKAGAREIAVSYLFLRPGIKKSLQRHIGNTELVNRILAPYSQGQMLPVGIKSYGLALPRGIREKSFERIKALARDFGIAVAQCGCKNSDITGQSCHLTRMKKDAQMPLFE